MNLVERVKAILQNPKSEWIVIDGERHSAGYLFTHYVAIIAAIPLVAGFVGAAITGYVGYRVDVRSALVWALIVYGLTLVSVFLSAYLIDFLAGVFGGRRNSDSAMKVAAYAPTAAWVASVFDVQPAIAFLSLMGLYSFYLLYTGLAVLMKPAAEKLLLYTIAVVLGVGAIWLVVLGIAAMTLGPRMLV
jgi:MFS family permease